MEISIYRCIYRDVRKQKQSRKSLLKILALFCLSNLCLTEILYIVIISKDSEYKLKYFIYETEATERDADLPHSSRPEIIPALSIYPKRGRYMLDLTFDTAIYLYVSFKIKLISEYSSS